MGALTLPQPGSEVKHRHQGARSTDFGERKPPWGGRNHTTSRQQRYWRYDELIPRARHESIAGARRGREIFTLGALDAPENSVSLESTSNRDSTNYSLEATYDG